MAEKVGEIYYSVTLDTKELIEGQRRVDREVKKTSDSLGGMGSALTATAAAVAVLAAAYAALKLANLADEFRLLGARVDVAADSIEAGAAAMTELVAVSRRTQSSLAGNIEVFARLNQSIKQMGGTQEDTLQITELLAKAIKVSGANAVEAKAAMLQFGQALGSGKLQGDELRSLLENAPYLMKQLADGIGVPVGALKKLGEEGKLTADVVTNALTKAAAKIDEDFQKFPQTIASAMVVAQDSAALAILKFDELAGSSAALTGVTKGLSETLDQLASQFGAANDEAGKMGRNQAVAEWSQSTKMALSYVVDAADLTWQTLSVLGRNVAFVFTSIGTEIGGIAAQAVAVARGDFAGAAAIGDAMKADAVQRRKDLDDADAKTLAQTKLAGQKMREAWEQGAGGGRGFVNPASGNGPSKLSAPAGTGEKKGAKFDAAGYIAGLEQATLEGLQRVNAAEAEGLRKNAELLKAGKITREQAAQGAYLIEQNAAEDRLKLLIDEGAERASVQEKEREREREQAKKDAETLKQATEYGAQLTRAVNPVDALRQEYEAKLQLVTQYEQLMATAGVDATEQGLLARGQIERQYELQRLALAEQTFRSQSDANAFLVDSLNALSNTATSSIMGLINGTMTAQEVMRGLANTVMNEAVGALVQIGVQQIKNALVSQTVAAADKARAAAGGAVYAASVAAQVTGMSAMAAQNAFAATAAIPIVGPGLAPAAAAAAGAAAAAIGSPAIATAPLAGAREHGGPVNAGSLYRVGEKNKPEMFMSGSKQYMIPGDNGRVLSNAQISGGGSATASGMRLEIKVEVINQGAPVEASKTTQEQQPDGSVLMRVFLKSVAEDIASGGVNARAMQQRFPQLKG